VPMPRERVEIAELPQRDQYFLSDWSVNTTGPDGELGP
jgi:hypothetical protein